jgi:hypothetical protein
MQTQVLASPPDIFRYVRTELRCRQGAKRSVVLARWRECCAPILNRSDIQDAPQSASGESSTVKRSVHPDLVRRCEEVDFGCSAST